MPFEVDFLPVGTKTSSGDAIAIRYSSALTGSTIHVVDGGYADTAPGLIQHVRDVYGTQAVAHVVLSHADGDHAAGLGEVLRTLNIGTLWMNRPWIHAAEIIHHFHGNWTVAGLTRHLREQYPMLVELEDIAASRCIPIREAFQGAQIGQFTVLAPSRSRYLQLLPNFDKTPERKTTADSGNVLVELIAKAARSALRWVAESWWEETLSERPELTTASNESSIVQMAVIDGQQLVLTGDVGPDGLREAADFAEARYGRIAPTLIQIPHHGSRRNVTPSTLDRWLGPVKVQGTGYVGTAFCSAARLDEDHPRRKVINAFTRRGYQVHVTNGRHITCHQGTTRTGDLLIPESFSAQVEE